MFREVSQKKTNYHKPIKTKTTKVFFELLNIGKLMFSYVNIMLVFQLRNEKDKREQNKEG